MNIAIFFFYSFIDFINFFPPFSTMPLPQLLKKNFIPLFRQWHCHNLFVKFFFFFFFLFTSGTPRTGSRTGQRKFGITVAEIPLPKILPVQLKKKQLRQRHCQKGKKKNCFGNCGNAIAENGKKNYEICE